MLAATNTYDNNNKASNIIASGSSYVHQMMKLYQESIYEEKINSLLIKKIETVNQLIKSYVEDRENSFLLFCTSEYDLAIEEINKLNELSEFLLAALTVIHKNTSDSALKKLSGISIEVLREFIVKLIEFNSIYGDLKNYDNEVDEESEDYKNKMAKIAELISNNDKTKSGNSIRELLAL